MTEDEMVEWHHQLNGHEFEQALGAVDVSLGEKFLMRSCREPARESPPITRLCGRVLVGEVSQNSRGAALGLPERLPQNQSLSVLLLHDFHQLLRH